MHTPSSSGVALYIGMPGKTQTYSVSAQRSPHLMGSHLWGLHLPHKKITQGPKQHLVRCQLVDLCSAQAKRSTQRHLAHLAIARPSFSWVGHHWQVVRVTTLAWLQPSQASAWGHKDKPQQVQLCHGSPFGKKPWPSRSPAITANSGTGLGKQLSLVNCSKHTGHSAHTILFYV